MAAKMVTTITCDIDDVEVPEGIPSVRFAVAGKQYLLDLCEQHRQAFDESLREWTDAARVDNGQKKTGRQGGSGVDVKAVRAWARAHGVEVSERGRIKASVIEQYKAAA